MPGKPMTWNAGPEPDIGAYGPIRDRRFAKDQVLILLDARHAAYRSMHTRDLHTKRGIPTSALHGLIEIVQAACRAANTGRVLCVWDGGLRYKRAMYPGYKERQDRQRSPEEMQEHLRQQDAIKVAYRGLGLLGVPQVLVPELEADDVIGMLASLISRKSRHPAIAFGTIPNRVIIVSDDKDYYQLIDDCVSVWRGAMGELVDLKNFTARFPFTPDRYVDYKALVGEAKTGDNIPGVSGIGDVTACKMVGSMGGIEDIIKGCALMARGARATKLESKVAMQADQARLSYRLARIMRAFTDTTEHGIDCEPVKDRCLAALKNAINQRRPMTMKQAVEFIATYEMQNTLEPRRFAAACGFNLRAV